MSFPASLLLEGPALAGISSVRFTVADTNLLGVKLVDCLSEDAGSELRALNERLCGVDTVVQGRRLLPELLGMALLSPAAGVAGADDDAGLANCANSDVAGLAGFKNPFTCSFTLGFSIKELIGESSSSAPSTSATIEGRVGSRVDGTLLAC